MTLKENNTKFTLVRGLELIFALVHHGGRILWRRWINFLPSYSYTSTWTLWGFARSQIEPRQLDTSEFIGCSFDGPPIAARLYLTNSAKRKRRKPPQLMER